MCKHYFMQNQKIMEENQKIIKHGDEKVRLMDTILKEKISLTKRELNL